MRNIIHPTSEEHVEGDGATIFEHACNLGFEGIVSKHRAHPLPIGAE